MADQFANVFSSALQNQYGPTADKYAKQYGIPTDVFRGMINDISGFNPYKVNTDGTGGIASLDQGQLKSIDIYNPNSSLQVAAAGLSSLYKDEAGGSWDKAVSMFKIGRVYNPDGTPQAPNSTGDMPSYDAMGNPTGIDQATADANAIATKNPDTGKAFWQYTSQDWKDFFQNSIYGLLFGIIGVVFILGSIYMLFKAKALSIPTLPKIGA